MSASWTNNDRKSRNAPTQEQNNSAKRFNVQETKEALKKGYASVAAEDPQLLYYKPPAGSANNTKASGPWASKPNTMASGKDFFLELRKQLSSSQHSSDRAGG
ncbi:hypothetical protein MMC14_000976 [Varicellaria rhodocarpa]|nr:hypothetical protein [Varicellaria rhodocarpa]